MNWIAGFYGIYARQLFTSALPFLNFVLSAVFFSYPLKKRFRLPFRLTLAFLFYWAVFTGIAVLRTEFDTFAMRSAVRVALYFLMLPYLFAFLQEPPSRVLLCWSGCVAAQEFASKLFSLLLGLFGRNDLETNSFFPVINYERDMLIQLAFTALCCLLLYLAFGKKDAVEQDRISGRNITVLSFFSTVFLAVMSTFIREYETESYPLYTLCLLLLLALSFVILFLRSGILAQSAYRKEIALMENMLTQERKQYDSVKENMDYITMKCHDLKHQLANFEGRLTEEEIASLREAIEMYDRSIKTGNEVLDVVLYEKTIQCTDRDITLSCLADGKALSFMGRTHLYALLNNALGNAMEASGKVPDAEKRVISMTVEQREDIVIEISNYFSALPAIENGKLMTTKKDKKHHGLGFRSMQYIVDLYGGSILYEIEDDIFCLSMHFPKNATLRKEKAA